MLFNRQNRKIPPTAFCVTVTPKWAVGALCPRTTCKQAGVVGRRPRHEGMVVCMSERREGHNATRRQTMKRWKVALVAVLTIAMVMQSSNVQAIAEGIAEGLAGEGRPPITDTMLTDGTGTDEATGTDAATGTEDVTTDETAEDTTSTEATTPETDETATDTEATEEESTDAPAASEEVVEDTTETEAPAEAPAEEADTTVTLNVEISGAKLTYTAEDGTEQNVAPETDPKSVDVPNTLDFKFTVTPDEGQRVSSVSYGEAVLTADETGTYTVAAADLTDGEKIVVTTEAIPAEETPAEEAPAEPEAPAKEELAEPEGTTGPTEDETVPEEPSTDGTAEGATPAEPEVLDPEEVVADVSSPAYEGYAYVGDVVVKVTAGEGVLPEGTTVSAYQVNRQDVIDAVSNVVEQNGKVVENSVAIDVTLLGPDGNVIQPDGAVNVCFFNSNVGDSTVNVYRVADDASTVQAVGTRQADASVQSFDVDHFSIYVVTEEGEPALTTYNFYVNDGIFSTQVVKTGDTLYEPAAPEANDNGFKFTGWYTKEQGGELFDGFGEQNVNEAKTVNLYAHFEEVHYVFFYDNQNRIFHTIEGMTGYSVSVEEATQILEQSLPINQGLAGWYTSENLEGDSVESVTLENANIYLYPKVVDGHWITFNTEGGTYIEPQFVAGGAISIEPETPTRTGYTFVDWETEDGKSFNFGDELTDDVKLVARWNPGQTSYRVIYWVEKANWKEGDNEADRYSFMSSEVIDNVSSGSTTNVGGIDWWDWDYNDLSFNDAELQTIDQQTVAGDGSTIVNVYYNRAVETVTFYTRHVHEWGERNWVGFGLIGHWEYRGGCYDNSGWHREGDTTCGLGDWVTAYTITAKVGAYIGDQWPDDEDIQGASRYAWATSLDGNTYQVYLDVMPSGGDEFWGEAKSGTSTAYYYVQSIDKSQYVLHHRDISAGTGFNVTKEDHYDLLGFTYHHGTREGENYDGAEFYYTRNDYTVTFINGTDETERSVAYQAPLNNLANYTPEKPDGIDENYTFSGWYDNQFGEGEPFNFDTTMPAYNLSLYAVWKAPEVSVSYYNDMDGTGSPQTVDGVSYGETINENQLSEPAKVEGKQFVGWATRTGDEGNYAYTLFNFDTEIRSDVVLYPYYISTDSYRVTYDSNGASGAAPTDEREYAEDAYADVLSAEGMTAPEGEVFLGWGTNEDGTGTLYQPEDKILIEGNVTLYAHWGHRPSQVTVTYDANYPEDAVYSGAVEEYTTDSFPSNAEHTVFEFEAIEGFEVPDGYKFVGWTNGSATYKPGDKVRVDELQKGGDNTLTAQWTHVGTQIYVKVVLDGNQVEAKNYVNPVVAGTTQGFMANYDPNTQLYTIDYTYENFNCADFKLETFDIPAGYVVSVSSDNTNDTTGIDGSTAEYHDPVEESGNWTLDNVPGGATVTVDLHKSEYAVKYVADDNGSVSTEQEVVKYGENANGSTATPDDGYFFVNWTDSEGEVVSTDPTYVPQNITANATYTAHFAKKYEVTVTANSKFDTYDGARKSVSGFQNETDKGVPVDADGITYYVTGLTSEASGVDVVDSVKSIPVTGTAVVKDANGNDVTDRFDVSVTRGSLTIVAREITVHAEKTVKYNGSDQTLDITEGNITKGTVADGESLDLSASITGRNKGVYEEFDADPTYKVTDGEGNETTANYSIAVTGKLTIEQAAADAFTGTVTLDDWTYGDEAKAEVPEVAPEGSDYDGPTYQYKVRGADDSTYTDQKPTQAGDYTVKAVWAATENCPEISDTDDFSILRRPLIVTTPSASKVYDGTALTAGPAEIEGVQGDDDITATAVGAQTEVGQSANTVDVDWNGLFGNYDVTYSLGTLTVFPQSIDPSDPDPDNPEPGDPDPSDPDPENPDQPFYTGVTVDSPSDVIYDGADHTWVPTVTDGDGNALVAKRDYTVSYSTPDRTNVTGTITVTITGTGNFAGTVTRTYQVVPRTLVVQANDQTKVQGAADPALSSGYNPAQLVAGEEPGWTGGLTREAGEAVGTYAITQGTLALEDNGDFLAANYVLTVLPGTLTITAAPAPDNPPATTDDGGDDTPTTPVGPTNPVPDDTLPVTDAADDATTDDATPEETVTDDENPLASGDEEGIEDNGNPLASGRGDEDCWVHWLILVGMILTAVYFVGVAVRRRKFTADLLDYEDKVLGNNRNDA